jgi:hypothetical protein
VYLAKRLCFGKVELVQLGDLGMILHEMYL